MKTGAIILAAGSSSRMGTSKQLLDVSGEKLLARTVGTVMDAGLDNIVVVLGADEAAHRDALHHLKVHIAVNEQWKAGMGSSIKAGMLRLTNLLPDLEAVMIFVCDQPLLTKDLVWEIVARFRETKKPIVASGYSGAAGVPVLFARSYFDELAQISDDQGAKKLIVRNPDHVEIVAFPGGEIDLDTREDYERFLANEQSGS